MERTQEKILRNLILLDNLRRKRSELDFQIKNLEHKIENQERAIKSSQNVEKKE